MEIIVVNKEIFQNRPPVISTLLSLSDLGFKITLITVDINEYWKNELESRNIQYIVIPDKKTRNCLGKIVEYLNFKKKVFGILQERGNDVNETLLWIVGGNTVFCLGKQLNRYRFILQLQELYENIGSYKNTFKKVINHAEAVFVNEYNRAILYQCWYNMKKRPYVIPNKPYFIDTNSTFDLSLYVDADSLERIKNSKVILFQGQIVSYRDLSPYIRAAKEIGGYQIVLLGNEYGMVDKYRQIDDSLIYIKRIPAPQYLGITALAHICLITYDPCSLNNAYCAPNKIYEYGAYGKPMLGNDIPGLKVVEKYHAGLIVDDEDVESIKAALIEIDNNYAYYSEGAKRLFESVDNKTVISKAIKAIDNH